MLLNLQSVCCIVYVVKNYVNPKPHYYQNQNQGWIHDFPGGAKVKGGAPTYSLAKYSWKLHENENNL